ncbi:MAG: hypothetical protein LBB85_06395 [Dysgonamonadaceae bacterium]|jgi:hypothetical protein|nr:hypothetical protein [Dysgonamonadaceae bacterium]
MIRIYKCKACEKIHLEAGNALIHFSSRERLSKYLDYLESVDASCYASLNRKKGLTKDIFLPVDGSTVNLAFSLDEFEEIKKVIRNYLSPSANPFPYGRWMELQTISWN